ncbi:hypothetical protein CVV43_03070 [Candidatus Saccharibacteria bacterium HGW-Saccharibacteria-1]|jgi:hypothetical protein|nr:MAG: hypothetical protein CVV43_03070 [Candidatus Saccharibacteria bacterium HGW-Saccharibacteria-1]
MKKLESKDVYCLKELLESYNIDVTCWGKGCAKTADHLLSELHDNEAILVISESGKLLKKTEVVRSSIYYNDQNSGKLYRLAEERQVFSDGRERRRDSKSRAVFEKMRPDEIPEQAMLRGIREELGVVGDIILTYVKTGRYYGDSISYPGLRSEKILYTFEAIFSDEQFKPDGYIEIQPDKTTYFGWVIQE